MKSYLDLIGQYGRVHKKKNRITVWCIAIAVCLVTAIFGLADMAVRAQTIYQINSQGNWHLIIKNIDEEKAKLIGNRVDVAVSGWVLQGSNGILRDKPLAFVGMNEALAPEMTLVLQDGFYPQKSNEALLNNLAMKQKNISVGDTATVTLPNGEQKEYKIVGSFKDMSMLLKADTYGLVLSESGIRAIADKNFIARYYIQFKHGANMRKAIDEIKDNYHLSEDQVSENAVLLGLTGQSRNSYVMYLYRTAAVFFVMVLTAGVLMIASSFNMSVLERIQFFGLLRCLGASKKQVKKFVLTEGIHFSLNGIPIGLLLGTLILWGSCAFLKYVNPAFFGDMPLFGISWISLISGVVVGFLTVILASLSPCKRAAKVSPLSAVTGNVGQSNVLQSKRAVKTMHKRVEIAMGIHHAFVSKKNILLMTGSFAMSIILFLTFHVTVDFMHQAIQPLKPYAPDISVISGDNTTSLSEDLFEQIKNNPGVNRAYGRMFAYDIPATSTQGDGKINLISYEKNQFEWAKKQLTEGSVDEVVKEEDKVLIVYSDDLKWKKGDRIDLEFPSGEKNVEIAGILSSSPFDSAPGTQTVICSEKTFKKLTGKRGYTIIDMQMKKDASDETVSQIRNMTTSQMRFSDRRQGNKEAKTAFYTYAIFIYGFLVIIGSITVFNIINSMNVSVSSRMNQYGMMRAVGMSGKQLHRMVTAEAVTYAVCGCLTGCILGLPLHRFIFHSMITSHWGLKWQPPFVVLVFIIGITFLATFLSVIGPVKKISKMDIVNVVNAQ
ncbi:ABC transporter permease [Acidilutibacter cellobiosedens]|uniref:ABC transporter permease n=1 Tax=Acidilutibacter cellobiosedens TaxID=2507161 RepID=A0A410Q8G7_9FIRM|nr:FtsX-like permease family protein [Acidilutibacter cellobiosedens]QAT60204.1 ABC transporter permease [Acidilutibacter cellobiosedens]